jgi:hypothetical protein
MHVILHLEQEIGKVCYPFKFNSTWLEEPEFVNLVREKWDGLLGNEILNPMDSLVKKIKILKSMVINWERKKKLEAKEELGNIEMDLDKLYTNFPGGFEKEEDKVLVLEKEKRKLVLLRQEEDT